MGLISDAAVSRGDIGREQAEIKRDIEAARSARRAERTSVGAEGMRFHSGGGITIADGGDIIVEDGGLISAQYPSGRSAAGFGPLVLEGTDIPDGHGLLVQADDDSQGRDIFRAMYWHGQRYCYIGQNPEDDASGAVEVFVADATRIGLHSHSDELRLQTHHEGPLKIYGGDGSTGASDIAIVTFGGGHIQITADADFDIDAVGHAYTLADGEAALGGGDGTFLQPEENLVDSANVHMDTTTGRITYVSSSSERVKRDIRDLAVDPAAVLGVRARSWLPGATEQQCPPWLHATHASEADCRAGEPIDPPEDAPRVVGFVAEELDAAGLGDFVVHAADGAASAIRYDRLAAALLPVIQAQQAQIDALAARLDAIEGRAS